MRHLVLAGALLLTTFGLTSTASATWFDLSIAPVVTTTDTTVEIPITIDTSVWGGPHVDFVITGDASDIEIVDINPGAGLTSYIKQHGLPYVWQVNHTASSASVDLQFSPGYDSSIYGPEFFVMKVAIVAPEATTSTLYASGTWMPDFSTTITIEEAVVEDDPFVRGDVNLDSTQSLDDVFGLLDVLFTPDVSMDCLDTGDVDDNGVVDLADVVGLLDDIFGPTQQLPVGCGSDITADDLPTCEYSSCP